MGRCIYTSIQSCFHGSGVAYVYALISKSERIVYVGQTAGAIGTLGRAVQHLERSGTFRRLVEEEIGTSVDSITDLVLLSFELPRQAEFVSVDSSYREAVEYLVQIELHKLRGTIHPSFKVISNVKSSDRETDETRAYAKHIASRIIDCYSRLSVKSSEFLS